jgi:hypothetical protein
MVLSPHPLVAAHLLVHLLLHVFLLLLRYNRRCPNGSEIIRAVLEQIRRDAGRHLMTISNGTGVVVSIGIGQWKAISRRTLRTRRDPHRMDRMLRGDAVTLAAVATCLFVGSVCVSENNRNPVKLNCIEDSLF